MLPLSSRAMAWIFCILLGLLPNPRRWPVGRSCPISTTHRRHQRRHRTHRAFRCEPSRPSPRPMGCREPSRRRAQRPITSAIIRTDAPKTALPAT
ncbi:uncharacterized protein BJ171DRAFT_501455 [Polychytrium aggregatum]|uniref:uncharacterized protein n=1 Tax=Polychytrium aggregatum TaxID=110093 RepID=UPI0022FDD414|nr:uncharacterized protein BJ171DRAFT_501455 [Polychytrium aggregatum]KAI9205232.1 hypothetical protein BJ171DRAFT_501455 [Polychytrium aggregatum]